MLNYNEFVNQCNEINKLTESDLRFQWSRYLWYYACCKVSKFTASTYISNVADWYNKQNELKKNQIKSQIKQYVIELGGEIINGK